MTLLQRCECSLGGFLALDLFKIVADRLCKERNAPTGSFFLAKQTMLNLQATALTTVVICVTKEAGWSPWVYGFQRLSEQAIEQHFGHLRCQATNAQLSTRAYWMACARTLMKTNEELNRSKKAKVRQEPHLSDEEFRACCHRALEGALNLVSTCSGIPSKQLEQVYRELCSETAGESFFELSHDMDYDEEMEDLEICLDQPPADCMGFLTQLQDETKLLKGEDDEKIPTRQDDKMPDLRHVPDSELLREVLSASSATDPFRMENSCSPKKRKDLNTLPTTLLEALSLGQRGCVFNSLFRLAVFLRSGVGGSDCGWLQNPKNCRYNEHRLAQMEAEKAEPAYRSRAGRLDKWKELVRKAQEDLELPPNPPESVQPFDNNGFLRVYLTGKSGEALARVESMKLWLVQPAMARGRKRVGTGEVKAKTTRAYGRRRRKHQYKAGPDGKPVLVKKNKKKQKRVKKEKAKVVTDDPSAADFRRSAKGAKLIQQELKELRNLDSSSFPTHPIFELSGKCRMKYPAAAYVSFEDVVEYGPACVDMMSPDLQGLEISIRSSGMVQRSTGMEEEDMEEERTRVGKMVAILDTWKNPVYLGRVWTIYEQFMARSLDIPVTFAMPESSNQSLQEQISRGDLGIREITESLSSIDVQHAKAWDPQDEIAVKGVIQEVVKEQFQRLIDGTREQRSGSVTTVASSCGADLE
ncbi:unnamed protein product [Durusdinium trenchii]|uniref:Uncharacterized protein n=1 Tax=Durusdinium trenchii TaxID=1381693 RepID=A0ABP0RPY9_9DINO